jgi:hypothetical protein
VNLITASDTVLDLFPVIVEVEIAIEIKIELEIGKAVGGCNQSSAFADAVRVSAR